MAVINVFCGSIECEKQVNNLERYFDNLNALPLIAPELCDDTPFYHWLKMHVYYKLKVCERIDILKLIFIYLFDSSVENTSNISKKLLHYAHYIDSADFMLTNLSH